MTEELESSSLSPSLDFPLDDTFDVDDILGLAESPTETFDRYATTNAVHMEIQENAKLPTFNLPVDRRNSSVVSSREAQQCSPTTRRELDELVRLSEKDVSLSEVFLKSTDRSSQNMNYSSAGALLGNAGDYVGQKNDSYRIPDAQLQKTNHNHGQLPPSSQKVNDISDPLAYKHNGSIKKLPIQSITLPTETPLTSNRNESINNPPLQSATAPTEMLSLPSLASEGPPALAAAVATAAAIALQTPTSNPVVIPTTSAKLPDRKKPDSSHSLPTSIASSTNASRTNPQPAPVPYMYPPARSVTARPSPLPYSRLNAVMKVPTPQMVDATKRRSQFGFGGNHQIPSVPMPPKRVSYNAKKSKKVKAQPIVTVPLQHATNSGPAYERKKQRAKNARVKLNESIERLAIALSLAGSQSQHRLLSLPNDGDPRVSEVMKECVEIAESAKKWDRPEFVGTAATLIQGLNSQCEVLMAEVMRLQQTNGHKRVVDEPAASPATSREQNGKRRKVLDTSKNANDVRLQLFRDEKILESIGRFLDPQSLLRCQRLTRTIRKFFTLDSLWLSLCVQRFGPIHVRQWKEKFFDDNNEQEVDSLVLYRKMDAANVKPVIGSLPIIAETRMENKISAWVNIIERSNGETYRSVQQLNENGSTRFSSLPVAELRLFIQNTGCSNAIRIKEQSIFVDASTRRRGEEWQEITHDARFEKRVLDSQEVPISPSEKEKENNMMVTLPLYKTATIVVFVHCKGCSTTSKFQRRANFTKVYLQMNGITIPLVIPFFRDS
eukprot:CAMPEP_0194208418 /NCGR_PEP_ID=MMETSP0156-20130528/6873_1 /TAXON_ID=33649 /ORGANISM="Thalassionema nitzschioides, Strain L26-B" /LENGTH=778 /DNA_ID=CAMNT_0038935379 /DNA_START=68 /DNA_END=2404 /DNA_ORIENTATION=-